MGAGRGKPRGRGEEREKGVIKNPPFGPGGTAGGRGNPGWGERRRREGKAVAAKGRQEGDD